MKKKGEIKIKLYEEAGLWIASSKNVSSQGRNKYSALRNFIEALRLYDEDLKG